MTVRLRHLGKQLGLKDDRQAVEAGELKLLAGELKLLNLAETDNRGSNQRQCGAQGKTDQKRGRDGRSSREDSLAGSEQP